MNRYDTTRGSYKPAIMVARYSETHYESTQWGDVVAVHDGRVGIAWELAPVGGCDWNKRKLVFSVHALEELPELVATAEAKQADWAREAAAEWAAEHAYPQHLVW